ncbi:MAG TPA: hypothetical protein VKN74_01560 [Candidatus Mcinerneyibacterium sp.]|nr:hypothetical protein [Candidatus Mcinerneyibacterium sp.]
MKNKILIVITFIFFIISCSQSKKNIIFEKKLSGYLLNDETITFSPPILNNKTDKIFHNYLNRIGKAKLKNKIKQSAFTERNIYNNKKVFIIKSARASGADKTIYTKIKFSSFTNYPSKNDFPDHVQLENEQAQLQFHRVNITIIYELYDIKTLTLITDSKYQYSFSTNPFAKENTQNGWDNDKIEVALKNSANKFIDSISGKKINTKRILFFK